MDSVVHGVTKSWTQLNNFHLSFPSGSDSKESACDAETRVWSLHWEEHLEEEMAAHSSILAWRISWTEEAGGLQSMELKKVGHNWSDLARH